jgi:hypothetical protein
MCVCVCVCDQLCNKILNAKFKIDKYFVDEVETQLREKSLRGSQTQDIHYLENKASYKVVALIYPMQWTYLELWHIYTWTLVIPEKHYA